MIFRLTRDFAVVGAAAAVDADSSASSNDSFEFPVASVDDDTGLVVDDEDAIMREQAMRLCRYLQS